MKLLTPNTLPFLFLAIATAFGVMSLRRVQNDSQRLISRNRLRMAGIFALAGILNLLWRLKD